MLARLIDLIVARSAGVIAPLSFPSLRRTSCSSTASSPKSTTCGLQSVATRFTNLGAGGVEATGAGGGVAGGAEAEAVADGAGAEDEAWSHPSESTEPSERTSADERADRIIGRRAYSAGPSWGTTVYDAGDREP